MSGTIFTISLIAATLFTTLVAGLLFGFAVVTMPGIRKLNDRGFVRAFQVMDEVIQKNQPLFLLAWAGSALLLVLSSIIFPRELEPTHRIILIGATALYFVGVQVPTIAVNVPLNNALQKINADSADDATLRGARASFELRWNRWNRMRTAVAAVVALALLVLLFLL